MPEPRPLTPRLVLFSLPCAAELRQQAFGRSPECASPKDRFGESRKSGWASRK